MGSEPQDGAPRPTNVTETLVANGGIVPDAFMASSTARAGWSADRAVTELYSLHYRALVRLAAAPRRREGASVPAAGGGEPVPVGAAAPHRGGQEPAEGAAGHAQRRARRAGPAGALGRGRRAA